MFSKTGSLVMESFVSKIDSKFSIKEISDGLKKPYPLIHRTIQSLLTDKFLIKDERGLLSLNYKENHSEIAYAEALRAKRYLCKDGVLSLFVKDACSKMGLDFFVLLIFGSYVTKKTPRDIDILVIIEDENKINETQKILDNLISDFSKKFEVQVISLKSAYEMFSKREKVNILNETLNNHVLLFGAENYYRILKNAR